jgi:hypothetical protein
MFVTDSTTPTSGRRTATRCTTPLAARRQPSTILNLLRVKSKGRGRRRLLRGLGIRISRGGNCRSTTEGGRERRRKDEEEERMTEEVWKVGEVRH